MRVLDRELRPWLHGAVSVLLGMCFLWVMMSFPPLHYSLVDGVNSLLYYPEKPIMELRNIVKYSSNWVLERATLRDRVLSLESENQKMAEALMRAAIVLPKTSQSFVEAKVTLRYPEDWWQELRIDKGRDSGISEGAAVMSGGYLIGRVARLGDGYAWVELITSSSFLIAAAVDETRDLGVLNGDDRGNLRLLYVPEDRKLKNGMRVSTSLMSEFIPPGLPIGSIIGSEGSKDGFMPMKISAGAHLTQLYGVEVYVSGGAAR